MNKELFVSSTPHETKVGMVEDDLLAEIYLERENEYTLAGSIYKGRVTRVLPGMQSAFVDIGLERDAFLYVSDFMELQDEDEVEEIPTNLAPSQPYQSPARAEAQPLEHEAVSVVSVGEEHATPEEQGEPTAQPGENRERSNGGESRGGRGDWRSRRRRGRRGERMPESKFARPTSEAVRTDQPERTDRPDRPERSARPERSERSEYGPPPGSQPILLPGESISKYQRLAQSQARAESRPTSPNPAARAPVTAAFPEDEPLFAKPEAEQQASIPEPQDRARGAAANAQVGSSEWDRQQKRLHEKNVAAVFGGEAAEPAEVHRDSGHDDDAITDHEHSDQIRVSEAAEGTMEEELIEEDEADLASYVEELNIDASFEEDQLEEETREAGDYREPSVPQIAASGEDAQTVSENRAPEPFVIEGGIDEHVSGEVEVDEAVAEQEAKEAEEAELEEAQAEAEALLDAEARGDGTVDARVEVRAPAGTAAYTQRAPRPAFDPRRGQRGRRGGGGGRRFRRHEPQNVPLITELLKEGQEILVQIAKEPIGKKGARITSHIALPGRFLVYMPTVNHTGVSRKISSEEERQRLKRIIISERENGHGGFIVRTAAQGASEEELRADIRFLKNLWSEIKTRADNGKGPTLIYHDLNVVERVLRDQVTFDFTAIWVDTEQEYERVLRFANRFQPALVRRVKLYSKEIPLFEQFGLNDEINKALKSKVWLKSGGYIVINQTEALIAIDVNTGKFVGKTQRLEDTIVKVNVDAIKEIVRQIRLRDLGGIIVIDFIDMDERKNRQKVMVALEDALRNDRAPSKVLQFNDFGLVAITRKRVKQSLERTLAEPCPYCTGAGFVKSVPTVCNELYIEMRKMAKVHDKNDITVRVHPEVAKALKANNGKLITEMEDLTGKTVLVKSDAALHQEMFDIH